MSRRAIRMATALALVAVMGVVAQARLMGGALKRAHMRRGRVNK